MIDLLDTREQLLVASMVTALKDEMQRQITAAYTKAAATAARADQAEKEAEKLQARLSRRSTAWDRERSDMYRQILGLRELLRRNGVTDSRLVGLTAIAVGGDGDSGDDPLGSTKAKALEQRLRRSEAEAQAAELRAGEAVSQVARYREALEDASDKMAAELALHEASKAELTRARTEISRLRLQLVDAAEKTPFKRGEEAAEAKPGSWVLGGGGQEWGRMQLEGVRARVRDGEAAWEDAAEGLAEVRRVVVASHDSHSRLRSALASVLTCCWDCT